MEQNQNPPVFSKRSVWHIVRVIYYMIRKSLSKKKFIVDFNIMLQRGKIAGKAIQNLITFNSTHHHSRQLPESAGVAGGEYEFSCSNTPTYNFSSLIKRKFTCAHAPPTQEDDVATMNAVKVVLEMLNNNNGNGNNSNNINNDEVVMGSYSNSPVGYLGRNAASVRQLRITDSPFPVKDVNDGIVDKAAEAFIDKFYKDLKKQKGLHGF
ncbi:hypothetical protein ACFE04_008437 [Oxalis oulophora]